MITKTIVIPGMNNQQDAAKVSHALYEMFGIAEVEISLARKEAVFTYNEAAASFEDFEEALLEEGYEIIADNGVLEDSLHQWQPD